MSKKIELKEIDLEKLDFDVKKKLRQLLYLWAIFIGVLLLAIISFLVIPNKNIIFLVVGIIFNILIVIAGIFGSQLILKGNLRYFLNTGQNKVSGYAKLGILLGGIILPLIIVKCVDVFRSLVEKIKK